MSEVRKPHLEQVANALLHLRKTECDGCNGAADVIVSLEEQLGTWPEEQQQLHDRIAELVEQLEASEKSWDKLSRKYDELHKQREAAHERLTHFHAAGLDRDGREWSLVERIDHLKKIWYSRGYNTARSDQIDATSLKEQLEAKQRDAQIKERALTDVFEDASRRADELQEQFDSVRADAARAVFLAEHLFQMIDPQTWRYSGGDDGQGHYEGDYRAEQVRDELAALSQRVSNPAKNPVFEGHSYDVRTFYPGSPASNQESRSK